MPYVEKLREYHKSVLGLSQSLEHEAVKLMGRDGRLSRDEYLDNVLPNREQFKTGLLTHFKIEELALFPVLMRKSPEISLTVFNFLVDHTYIIDKLREFDDTPDYEGSVVALRELFALLVKHAKAEDKLFPKIVFTFEEEAHIFEVATIVDQWPPIVP